ncbi:MAG: histidine triad nucleotide-binding protein [Candidatus Eremiobacteraeota bacterium]|nr:histidine triad nucleotide-binding protein [Candidatus Eremiobacteraeota bacterium]
MAECIFCKIAAGTLPAQVVQRDTGLVAIEDRNPQAPTHLLVMPVEHHANLHDVAVEDPALMARLIELAAKLGRERGGDKGFRLVVNTGRDGGQTVDHVHVHVFAGRRMDWPPG